MLIKKEIHILLKLGASPDKDVIKLMESYDDVFIHFVKIIKTIFSTNHETNCYSLNDSLQWQKLLK